MKLPLPRASLWGLAVSQAPLIFEAASRVLGLIRGRLSLAHDPEGRTKPPHEISLPELAAGVDQLRRRVQAIDEAQLEQVKLVQQVVEQNRTLTLALHSFSVRYRILIAVAAVLAAVNLGLAWWIWHHLPA